MTLMDIFDQPPRADANERGLAPGVAPPRDYTMLYLRARALDGAVPVYFAAVPRGAIRPFNAEYDAAGHPQGQAAIAHTEAAWREGIFPRVWVYPSNDIYVLGEDYVTWAAVQRAQPDYLPCWVLCYPSVAGALYIQGPIGTAGVRKVLFGSGANPAH
jgi:hypothetical protein